MQQGVGGMPRKRKPFQEVRNALYARNLTYRDMAKRLGISIGAFNARMQNRVRFYLDEAVILSEETGKPLDELFRLSGCKNATNKNEKIG
jgi:transcriptional regulator with XRE-family HTH domain